MLYERFALVDTYNRNVPAEFRPEQIQKHIAAFLASGGQIQQIPPGVCVLKGADPQMSVYNRDMQQRARCLDELKSRVDEAEVME